MDFRVCLYIRNFQMFTCSSLGLCHLGFNVLDLEILDGRTIYNSMKATASCTISDPEELVRSILTSLVTLMEGSWIQTIAM